MPASWRGRLLGDTSTSNVVQDHAVMSNTHLTLEDLPVEIIQRIASLGPCESALTLSLVSRSFHRACNDRQVFKAILENRSGYGGSRWHAVPLAKDSSASAWARYALADSKAGDWVIKAQEGQQSLPSNFHTWGLQLMCYSHPFLNAMDPTELYNIFNSVKAGDGYLPALNLALRMRSTPCFNKDHNYLTDPKSREAWLNIRRELVKIVMGMNRATENVAEPQERLRVKLRIRTVMAVGILDEMLREAKYDTGPSTLQTLNLPLPFHPFAVQDLPTCHLAKMTSPRYLEDGPWMGYYCYYSNGRRIRVDPPMRDVQFITSAVSGTPYGLNLKGSGQDQHGSFTPDGSLVQDHGAVSLTKRYTQRHFFNWSALMTPFGIVGIWSRHDLAGWLWLYKDSQQE